MYQISLSDNNYRKVSKNSYKYPFVTCTTYILIAVSLISLYNVFVNMFTEYLDPPFKIETETNSSSQTALNKTALERPFKNIYTFVITSDDGSDEISAPSFQMNVKHWIADTGIALAVFFLVLGTLCICGFALYGILKEERIFLLPLHIYVYVLSGMVFFLIIAFLRSVGIIEAEMNKPSFNSTVIERKEYKLGFPWVWVSFLILAATLGFHDAFYIGSELNYMETVNKINTRGPCALRQATSNVQEPEYKMSRVSDGGAECE